MEKQIKIELPDFCEGCKEFELLCEKVHAKNLDGDTITMDYYSCSHKDFCCYQYRRLASGSSPTEDSDNVLTYGDVYKMCKTMFPKVCEEIVNYRPAETPCTIHLWLKDNRELAFTYVSANEWQMETYEHYRLRNDLTEEDW